MSRPGSYEARCGMVWICGCPHTVTEAEAHAASFLESAINAPGSHWESGWGPQLEALAQTIREAKGQAVSRPVEEIAA